MKSLLTFIALSVAWCAPVAGQIKHLVENSRITTTLTFDGPRNFALPTACDDKGYSYLKLSKQDGKMTGPVFRVSDKGAVETEFDSPEMLANTFAVRPDAGLAVPHLDGKTKVVDNFGPDGTRQSQVRLDTPPIPFFPMQIAVFPSSGIFLAGQQYRQADKASAAVYDPAGHLVKQLDWEEAGDKSHAIAGSADKVTAASRASSRSIAITGDDGYVYFMRAMSPPPVYVISSTGEIVRKLIVKGPTGTNWPAFGLRVIENRLLVEFYRECRNPLEISSCQGTLYTVVDATTGERIADFEPDQRAAGPIACYFPNPDRFFTFSIPAKENRLEMIETEPR
jgi:hypothetical protein